MAQAHPQATGLGYALLWAAAGLVLGFIFVIAIPPGAVLLAAMLGFYDVVSWRRQDPRLRRYLATTCAFVAPLLLYFTLAAVR